MYLKKRLFVAFTLSIIVINSLFQINAAPAPKYKKLIVKEEDVPGIYRVYLNYSSIVDSHYVFHLQKNKEYYGYVPNQSDNQFQGTWSLKNNVITIEESRYHYHDATTTKTGNIKIAIKKVSNKNFYGLYQSNDSSKSNCVLLRY